MKLIAELVTVMRGAPSWLAISVNRWLLRVHAPVEVGPPHYAGCRHCWSPWPCSEWLAASDRLDALTKI